MNSRQPNGRAKISLSRLVITGIIILYKKFNHSKMYMFVFFSRLFGRLDTGDNSFFLFSISFGHRNPQK